MAWTDDWIGLPYEQLGRGPETYDCLGLFLALQRARFGRDLFDPMCTAAMALRRSVVEAQKESWREAVRVEEGRAILFRTAGRPLHVAYAVDNRRMLHTSQETGASVLEDIATSYSFRRIEGIYEHVG